MSWTLTLEVMFYGIFALGLVLERRTTLIAVIAWGLMAVVIDSPTVWLSPFIMEFTFGVAFGAAVSRGLGRAPLLAPLALATAPLLFVANYFQPEGVGRIATFGLSATGLIWLAVALEDRGYAAPKFAIRLGAASYALYLCHLPVMEMFRFSWQAVVAAPDVVFGMILVTSIAAALMWTRVEEPALRWFGRAVLRRGVTAPTPVTAATVVGH